MECKEKFSHEVFNYLGNKTYDFGGIVIKFDKKETLVKEASIERNIVKYEGVNIIGENIDTIKENISKAEKDHDDSTIYEEFLDEKVSKILELVENIDLILKMSIAYIIMIQL